MPNHARPADDPGVAPPAMTTPLFDQSTPLDTSRTIAIYERLRHLAPDMTSVAEHQAPQYFPRLRDTLDAFDALLLDGFGVLNVGAAVVPGAAELLAMAAEAGVDVMVLTNGGSKPSAMAAAKYRSLGLPIHDAQVVSSRDALLHAFKGLDSTARFGVIDGFADLPDGPQFMRLSPDRPADWRAVDGIGLFGAVQWNEDWQSCLEMALDAGVPVHVANPDVAAPHDDTFSFEPGFWAAAALDRNSAAPVHWYGKPHPPIFDLALTMLEDISPRSSIKRSRIAMVGDSLHTDVLGGNAAGLRSVLITSHGLFRHGGAVEAMDATGIRPDFITDTV